MSLLVHHRIRPCTQRLRARSSRSNAMSVRLTSLSWSPIVAFIQISGMAAGRNADHPLQDHQGGDLAVTNVYSLLQCITDCDNTTGCVDVSLSGVSPPFHTRYKLCSDLLTSRCLKVACYMKSSLGAAISANGVFGARLNVAQTPAACPQSNNTIVSSSNGAEFLVECGIVSARTYRWRLVAAANAGVLFCRTMLLAIWAGNT